MTEASRKDFDGLFIFLWQYRWIHDLHLTKFLESKVWENIPHEWSRLFSAMTVHELNSLPFHITKTSLSETETEPKISLCLPDSLATFLHKSSSLSHNRQQVRETLPPPSPVSRELKRGMSPKKLHEVEWMASLVHRVAVQAGCTVVVDVGSGLGYLGQVLHKNYGLSVIGLESSTSHTEGAEKRAAKQGLQCLGMRSIPFQITDEEDSIQQFCEIIHDIETSIQPCQHSLSADAHHHAIKHGNWCTQPCQHLPSGDCTCESHDSCPSSADEKKRCGERTCLEGCRSLDGYLSCCHEGSSETSQEDKETVTTVDCGCNRGEKHGPNCMQCLRKDAHETNLASDFVVSSVNTDCLPGVRSQSHETFSGGFNPVIDVGLSDNKLDSGRDLQKQALPQRELFAGKARSPVRPMQAHTGRKDSGKLSAEEAKSRVTDSDVTDITERTESECSETRACLTQESETQRTSSAVGKEAGRKDERLRVCLIGLHCCGDLTPAMLRLYQKVDFLRAVCCISCCYHKMQFVQGSDQFSNFPMSTAAKASYDTACVGRDASSPSTETAATPAPTPKFLTPCSLRLAAQETRTRWASQNPSDHDDHARHVGYRAILELFLRETSGSNQDRKSIRRLDYSSYEHFVESYSSSANIVDAQERQATSDRLDVLYKDLKPYFTHIQPYTCLQVVLQPVLESLILWDRQQWLEERGLSSEVVPVFDENISPRNLALVSLKQ